MAGGKGKRLGFITKKTAKPIININDKPFLIHQVNWLIKNGFTQFYFLLAYKNKKMKKVIDNFFSKKKLKYEIFLDKSKGTFPAIYKSLKSISSEFFYTNADEISYFRIKKMYKNFRSSKSIITCAVLSSNKGKLILNKNKKKIEINNNRKLNLYKDCGYKFINKKVFKNIRNKNFNKLEDFIYNEYIKFNRVGYYIINKLPFRIDTAKDIQRAKKNLINE